ncbi:hypothetical protein D9757_007926 [Collybiopsis confluens]|uniref:Meiotically up-regulated protein Msb1/Mug8 domain-containing protein n=1 Tax=Collybiopsis confluens TaxID=2823264 RepID=A0A8H5HBL7_9AGAR|nr:hypothetical protein D9757_007926 [Collybiopsis confluens]
MIFFSNHPMGFFTRSRNAPSSSSTTETLNNSNGFEDSVDQISGADLTASISGGTPRSKKEKKEQKKAEKAAKEREKEKEKERAQSRIGSSEQKSFEADNDDERVAEEKFLPLTLEPPPPPGWNADNSATASGGDQENGNGYGYLSFESHVVLGLEQVNRLVDVVCAELSNRGALDTPFIFSNQAMDIKASAVKRLIRSFLGTCVVLVGREKDLAEQRWREEAAFASMHELGMCLRWGLARVARLVDGVETRGMLNWDYYLQWAEQEQGNATSGHTPPSLSPLFGPLFFGLGPTGLPFHHTYMFYLRSVNAMEHILLAFIRWQNTSDATGNYSNILTSGTASTLGVPRRLKEWIKGYPAMLNTSMNRPSSAILASSFDQRPSPRPRKGARTVRMTSVKRNVKTYSRDLVKTAASWGERHTSGENRNGTYTPSSGSGFASSYEWLRISPPVYGRSDGSTSSRMAPRYSDAFRKRLNLSSAAVPGIGSFSHSPLLFAGDGAAVDFTSPPPSAFTTRTAFTFNDSSSPSFTRNGGGDDLFLSSNTTRLGLLGGSGGGTGEYKSLTDEKWNNFENIGFGGMGGNESRDKKLQFDLTESARAYTFANFTGRFPQLHPTPHPPPPSSRKKQAHTVKRETLDWTSFSSSGFSRSETPLQTALQLSISPIPGLTLGNSTNNSSSANSPTGSSSPPATPVMEGRKLRKKTRNGTPVNNNNAFMFDMEPVLGQEQIIEEAFVDVFCDLVRGSGWGQVSAPSAAAGYGHSSLRDEGRNCHWTLVEFKALPPENSVSHSHSAEYYGDVDSSSSSAADLRTSTALLLLEEYIPGPGPEY